MLYRRGCKSATMAMNCEISVTKAIFTTVRVAMFTKQRLFGYSLRQINPFEMILSEVILFDFFGQNL